MNYVMFITQCWIDVIINDVKAIRIMVVGVLLYAPAGFIPLITLLKIWDLGQSLTQSRELIITKDTTLVTVNGLLEKNKPTIKEKILLHLIRSRYHTHSTVYGSFLEAVIK